MRVLIKVMAVIASRPGHHYFTIRSCAVVDDIFRHNRSVVEHLYPTCKAFYSGVDPHQHVLIQADITSSRIDHIVAAKGVTFGPSAWLAGAIHCIGMEIYLASTEKVAARLREASGQSEPVTRHGDIKVQRASD